MRVEYLGPPGTFAGELAEKSFPQEERIPVKPVRKLIRDVENGKCDKAVVPAENFYNDEVRETYRTLYMCKRARIIAEASLPIVLCFGALKGHGKINEVMSKDQAIGQCYLYLDNNLPDADTVYTDSTSEAVEIIKRKNKLNSAVIASESAIREGGLELIAKDICPDDKTRFFIIGTEYTKPTGKDKTFLAINPPIRDRPGVLADILLSFSTLGINLEYIQSRSNGNRGYIFYFELNGHAEDERLGHAIKTIKLSLDPDKSNSDTVKILGSYHDTDWKNEHEN